MEKIKKRLSADLKIAMKERDDLAVKTIRSLMSALDNAGAVNVEAPKNMPMAGGIAGATAGLGSTEIPRRNLSGEEIRQIILGEMDEMIKAIEMINNSSGPETIQLAQRIKILKKYIP